MSFDSAFRPSGATVLVAASSSTAAAATQWSTGGMATAYVANGSTAAVYLAFGSSTVQAAQATTALPSVGLQLPSSASRCFSVGPNPSNAGWVSAVTSAGAALVFVTPGIGF